MKIHSYHFNRCREWERDEKMCTYTTVFWVTTVWPCMSSEVDENNNGWQMLGTVNEYLVIFRGQKVGGKYQGYAVHYNMPYEQRCELSSVQKWFNTYRKQLKSWFLKPNLYHGRSRSGWQVQHGFRICFRLSLYMHIQYVMLWRYAMTQRLCIHLGPYVFRRGHKSCLCTPRQWIWNG